MATIVITPHNPSPTPTHEQHQQQQQQMTVSSLYSWGKSARIACRDTIDVILDVLKSVVHHCRTRAIRTAAKIYKFGLVKVYLSTLCRYGLITKVSVTKRNRTRNKKTDRHEITTINRYYVTPKGYALIHIYDIMAEELTNCAARIS